MAGSMVKIIKMANPNINTSRAKQVDVEIFDYDNLPLSATYTSDSTPINLTNYRFDFYLKRDHLLIKTYSIGAGSLSSTFLNKTGGSVNVLEMEAMWENIQTLVEPERSKLYRLIQVVTESSTPYVYIVYNIHAAKY